MKNNKKCQKMPVEATITQLSHDGRGIARVNDQVTFIQGALPGETVTFRYQHRRSKLATGHVVEILQPSPSRVVPPCSHYDLCGACSTQHMASEQQLAFKQQTLLEQLQHFANIQLTTLQPPITGPSLGYRSKARLGVRHIAKKNKVLVGFREKNGRYLADLSHCQILDPRVGTRLPELSALIGQLSCFEDIPQIEVACGEHQVALIFRHLSPLTDNDLQQLTAFGKQYLFAMYLQPAGPDSVHKLWPEDGDCRLQYSLPEQNLTLQFHPNDFTQVNLAVNRQMITQAMAWLQPGPTEDILDLFCGLGNFSLPLAQKARTVTGVEGSPEMVLRATENADFNHLTNCHFHAANLDQDCSAADWAQRQYDKILLDPPRTGAEQIIRDIARFNAQAILYVSCNPATLARDSQLLSQQGYQLTQAGIMDMFPHTSHIESMALFKRR